MTYPIYNIWDDIAPTPEEEAQGVRDALPARGPKVGDAQRLMDAAFRRRAAPEKRLQWEIRRALEMLGFDVTSTSQPQRAMMTAGIPDLYARHPRWKLRIWIEVKAPRGRVRPAQAAWIEAERAAGGLAIIARSVDDVITALREAGAPIT